MLASSGDRSSKLYLYNLWFILTSSLISFPAFNYFVMTMFFDNLTTFFQQIERFMFILSLRIPQVDASYSLKENRKKSRLQKQCLKTQISEITLMCKYCQFLISSTKQGSMSQYFPLIQCTFLQFIENSPKYTKHYQYNNSFEKGERICRLLNVSAMNWVDIFRLFSRKKGKQENESEKSFQELKQAKVQPKIQKPKDHIRLTISIDALEKTRFSDLGLDFQRNLVTIRGQSEIDVKTILDEPIGKYAKDGQLPISMKRRPIHITIEKDGHLISESIENPDRLVQQCISKFLQLYNVIVKEGKSKGKILDKPTHSRPISDFTTTSNLSLSIAPKKSLVSESPAQKVFIADKVIATKDSIKLTTTLQIQKSNGEKVQRRLQEDVKTLMENVVNLIQTQTNTDAVKTVFESYERSVKQIDQEASKKVEKNLKDQKVGELNHHPAYILGQALKRQNGAEVTYSQEETAASVYSMLHLSTMFGSNYGKGLYKLNENEYTFNQLQEDWFARNKFIMEFKKQMAEYYNTTEDKIIVNEISRGSINVSFYYEQGNPEYSKSTEKHLKGKLIKEEQLFKFLNLSANHFDSKGDINFVDKTRAYEQVRGRLPYYQPSGWVRYGLDVKKWIKDGDKDWLKMNGCDEEWAVMFHGVKDQLNTVVKKIAQSTLKPGGGQAYRGSQPIITKGIYSILEAKAKRLGKKVKDVVDEYLGEATSSYVGLSGKVESQRHKANEVGRGVYGSPLIQTCVSGGYCGKGVKIDTDPDNEYIIAFQCRVRPDSIRICRGSNSYWVIRNPDDIRPYGLLISKRSVLQKQEHTDLYSQYKKSYEKFVGDEINPSLIE